MTEYLNELGEPTEFWEYFKEITKIPRCSGNEERIRNYIIREASKFQFESIVDEVGNVIILIPALNNNNEKKRIVLQCHLDMVCEKNDDINHDFSKDPINIEIIEVNGERWLKAKGTTLGADNGVGIAYLLTIMRKKKENLLNLTNFELILLFTVDEERGLIGAFNIKNDIIEGNYLINLDSEDDTKFTIGCAGGINTMAKLELPDLFISFSNKDYIPMKLNVRGLIGGHSGVDIHLGRANAIKIMAKVLWKLNNEHDIEILSLEGGNRANSIPREANAIIFIKKEKQSGIIELFNKTKLEIELGILKVEPNLQLSIEKIQFNNAKRILSTIVKNKLLHILYVIPNGPISYHQKISNLVYTSTNLASIKTNRNSIEIVTSQRSLHEISKQIIYEQIVALFKLADLKIKIQNSGDYPGWEPDFNSKLLKISKDTYKYLFNKESKIEIIHAGLETGILKKNFPQAEMISFGPTIIGAHSPDERLKINSIKKIWVLLITLLEKLE